MTVLVLWVRPRAPLNWATAVATAGYSLYSFSYIWVFGAEEPTTLWRFFNLSVWGFGLLIPSGALAAELLLARVRLRWALAVWIPLTGYWIFALLWGTAPQAIMADFHTTPWGNVGIHAHTAVLGAGAFVMLIQKTLVWVLLWRARRRPALQPARGLLTFFVPGDIAAMVLVILGQLISPAVRVPSTAVLLGGVNVGLLFAVIWRYSRLPEATDDAVKKEPTPDSENLSASLDRFGITPGERGVLQLLLQGLDRKTIAQRRFIAEGTVKTHIHSIYAKTGARNRVELMLLLSPPS